MSVLVKAEFGEVNVLLHLNDEFIPKLKLNLLKWNVIAFQCWAYSDV